MTRDDVADERLALKVERHYMTDWTTDAVMRQVDVSEIGHPPVSWTLFLFSLDTGTDQRHMSSMVKGYWSEPSEIAVQEAQAWLFGEAAEVPA